MIRQGQGSKVRHCTRKDKKNKATPENKKGPIFRIGLFDA
jgi:hypothetical protein